MRRIALALLLSAVPGASVAQVSPTPSIEDSRLQTVVFDPSRPVRLVAFPATTLTVMLLPGDTVTQVAISDQSAFAIRLTQSSDSINITPLRGDGRASLIVDTAQRRYEFDLDTGEGLAAAYLVRFLPEATAIAAEIEPTGEPLTPAIEMTGEYRLSGEPALRPSSLGDDGRRTYIEWTEHQSLPAVFGIGANGEEEVVDGFMRGGVFTIDRVYLELVFRIDKKRAKARRLQGLEG